MTTEKTIDIRSALLPLLGVGTVLLFWTFLSRHVAPDLPSPWRTWEESRQAPALRHGTQGERRSPQSTRLNGPRTQDQVRTKNEGPRTKDYTGTSTLKARCSMAWAEPVRSAV